MKTTRKDRLFILGTLLILGAVALFAPEEAQGADFYVETVTLSSASAVQTTKKYSVQAAFKCDGEVAVKECNDSTCSVDGAATVNDSVYGTSTAPWDLCIYTAPPGSFISFIRTGSATVTCKVSYVRPKAQPCL